MGLFHLYNFDWYAKDKEKRFTNALIPLTRSFVNRLYKKLATFLFYVCLTSRVLSIFELLQLFYLLQFVLYTAQPVTAFQKKYDHLLQVRFVELTAP